jgi:small subunit ribosomal protein S5
MNEPKEFGEKIVQVHRVSKKTKGGNKIGFSVVLVVGDKKGQVGVGLGKAPDVKSAIKKGVRYAKKHLIRVPLTPWGSIPHDILIKFGAARVILKKAPEGTGVIAGGAVRAVVEAAGVRNIVSKVLGTSNQASNVYATLEALKRLKPMHVNVQPAKKVEEKISETVKQQDSETVEKKIISEVKVVSKLEEVKKEEVKTEIKKPVKKVRKVQK